MNRSELIAIIQQRHPHLPASEVELAVRGLIQQMAETLSTGDRIEIRGFGSFALRRRESRIGRNPRTGALVEVEAHYALHFKPGKELREGVNETLTGKSPPVVRG